MRQRGMRTGVTRIPRSRRRERNVTFFGLPKSSGRVPLRSPRRKTKVVPVAGEHILRSLDVSTTPAPATLLRGRRRSTTEMVLSPFFLLPFHDDGDGM